jgi:hypothetical protein
MYQLQLDSKWKEPRPTEEGKVVESWESFDEFGLMRQIIVQEFRVARSIQRVSLPKEVPTLEGWQTP